MSSIDKNLVKSVAALSGLAIDDQELESVTSELASIERLLSEIQEINTDGVEPTAQVTGLEHVTREDKLQDYQVTPAKLLEQAPATEGSSIKVPSVK